MSDSWRSAVLTDPSSDVRGEGPGHKFHGNQFGHGGTVDAATTLKVGKAAYGESAAALKNDAEGAAGLEHYSGNDGFIFIQNYLRTGDYMHDAGAAAKDPARNAHEVKKVAAIDHAFDSSAVALPHDVSLDRIVGAKYAPNLEAGATFTDKGYTSTTFAQHGGKENSPGLREALDSAESHGGGGVVLRINTPSGTKVLAGDKSERELILARGTTFRVTGHGMTDAGATTGKTTDQSRPIIYVDVVS